MGNCAVKRVNQRSSSSIRILKDNGGILEFEGPKLVQEILYNFPGYGIFRRGRMSSPLDGSEHLLSGQAYYLLPLGKDEYTNAAPTHSASEVFTKLRTVEVLPSPGKGVWRVKLAMDRGQLEEVLAEEVTMGALVENMRMAAKSEGRLMPKRTRSSLGFRGSSSSLHCF